MSWVRRGDRPPVAKTLDPSVDVGTTHALPVAMATASPRPCSGLPVTPVRTVLFVDDDPDIRRIVSLALGEVGGWNVLLAASGAEAVAMAEQHLPDVILLDVMMPAMDGPSTFARLKQSPATAGIAVMFLTANVQRVEVERLASLGARGVIRKPFDPLLLAHQVRRCWAAAENDDEGKG